MTTIMISQDMLDEAEEHAKAAYSKVKHLKNYTGLEYSDAYFTGYLGELAFKELLDQRGKDYDFSIRTTGRAEKHDFVVYDGYGKNLTVDTKTGSKAFHKLLMMPFKQWQRYSYDYYVGVKLDMVMMYAEIHGYCKKDELIKGNFEVITMYKPLNQLTDIEELLEEII